MRNLLVSVLKCNGPRVAKLKWRRVSNEGLDREKRHALYKEADIRFASIAKDSGNMHDHSRAYGFGMLCGAVLP